MCFIVRSKPTKFVLSNITIPYITRLIKLVRRQVRPGGAFTMHNNVIKPWDKVPDIYESNMGLSLTVPPEAKML